ncbi:hypothetical protein BDC45DRAFT_497967 [Circinella umbellata]|nr:hypothetical protein BDC45DRAFT_497967 [Circinella umbellata]
MEPWDFFACAFLLYHIILVFKSLMHTDYETLTILFIFFSFYDMSHVLCCSLKIPMKYVR